MEWDDGCRSVAVAKAIVPATSYPQYGAIPTGKLIVIWIVIQKLGVGGLLASTKPPPKKLVSF